MLMRDLLGPVFADEQFVGLFSTRGKPAYSPGRLALVSVLQFAEGLSDRQAAHAVRARVDWKYALGLELEDCGFDHSVLSEFRDRLVAGGREQLLLDLVLRAVGEAGLLKAGGRARTDATRVLTWARERSRTEFAAETLRAALNAVAVAAPDWLAALAPPEWFDRYSRPLEDDDNGRSKRWSARIDDIDQVGRDGVELLLAVATPGDWDWLRHLPAVELLRQVWVQQFTITDGVVRGRGRRDGQPAGAIRHCNPYDPEARTNGQRGVEWDGYKVHLTETCEPDAPHLITAVETTPASGSDTVMVDVVHDRLARRGLLPRLHLVDAGYATAQQIVTARRNHGVELLGPVQANTNWQNTAGEGFGIDAFTIDWDNKTAHCPGGKTSRQWRVDTASERNPRVLARFSPADCNPCTLRAKCTTTKPRMGRQVSLRGDRDLHEVLQTARRDQGTPDWLRRYGHRAGIEGTVSQGVRSFGLRRSRYRGLAKTHLQHVLTAAGMNLVRLNAWHAGTPHASTRTSHFAALRPASQS